MQAADTSWRFGFFFVILAQAALPAFASPLCSALIIAERWGIISTDSHMCTHTQTHTYSFDEVVE